MCDKLIIPELTNDINGWYDYVGRALVKYIMEMGISCIRVSDYPKLKSQICINPTKEDIAYYNYWLGEYGLYLVNRDGEYYIELDELELEDSVDLEALVDFDDDDDIPFDD